MIDNKLIIEKIFKRVIRKSDLEKLNVTKIRKHYYDFEVDKASFVEFATEKAHSHYLIIKNNFNQDGFERLCERLANELVKTSLNNVMQGYMIGRKPLPFVINKDSSNNDIANSEYSKFKEINFPNGMTVLYIIKPVEAVDVSISPDENDVIAYEEANNEEKKAIAERFVEATNKAKFQEKGIESHTLEILTIWSKQ